MKTYFSLAWLLAISSAVLAGEAPLHAKDVYYVQPLRDLRLIDGELPQRTGGESYYRARLSSVMQPYAVLDGDGEIYLAKPTASDWNLETTTASIRAPEGQQVTGRLFWPKPDYSGMAALKFSLEAEVAAGSREAFLTNKLWHYENLLNRDLPGAAWHRHQAHALRRELGLKRNGTGDRERRFFGRRSNSMEDTFALVSGGRALSENLQLDRLLPTAQAVEATVPIEEIEGITVREFDWTELVKGVQPQQDPLASLIPEDQHALFFPTFRALVNLADNAQDHGAPVLRAAEPRAEDARTRSRYERQLCLSLSTAARLLGPQLIESVALTGADPYLRTGADVAVLFQAKNSETLRGFIEAQIALASANDPHAAAFQGAVSGVAYTAVRSPDRAICCFVATLNDVVVVTNSLAQLERLVEVNKGRTASLASLPEYAFFRHRYPRGDREETALLVISDATIRRWCGPRWRIGASRRTRAAAVMAEIQAAHLDRLVAGNVESKLVESEYRLPDAGQFTLAASGVQSPIYGSLEFQTPILELDLARVTKEEAEFYRIWRDGYQRNWSNFFDPIAVRFYAGADKLAADVTVMPLIDATQYRGLIDVSQGAKIAPQAGDPHAAVLVHAALAINKDSRGVKDATGMLKTFAPQLQVDPLAWMGQTIAVYLDDDPLWAELAKAEDAEKFLEKNAHRLPLALHVEVSSGLRLTAFLAGVRAFIEQTAPGMTVWDARQHQDQPYVRISPSERARAGNPDNNLDKLAVYYAASGEALIITLSEDLLRRALDRQSARRQAKADGQAAPADAKPWLGDNLCVQIDRKFVQLLDGASRETYQQTMQALAWGNLPILNEWKRRYPDMEPVRLHQQHWRRRLICPGGGEYEWNEAWQTMQSTVYGHPGEPKQGPSLPAALRDIAFGNFGLTFEEHGLRARVELEQKRNRRRNE